ncbi:MAG: PEGA domain-containing protein [Polyangiaceae bacterium]|nr:PEGA domain-containing protein [Polyangiaceae bacterium]
MCAQAPKGPSTFGRQAARRARRARARRSGHQKQSYDIAGNLGDVELTLGKPRDAAEHLEYSYRNWPTGKQEARQRTLERLSQAKKLVGALEISVNVDGAEITVNDTSAGRAPLNHDVFVEAGAVSISVTAPGYATETKTVPVAKGESRKVAIELTADGSAGAAATGGNGGNGGAGNNGNGGDSGAAGSGGTTVSTDGMSGKTVALIAGGALTVASAATWIGFYFAQKSTKDDANGLLDQIGGELGPNGCSSQPDHSLCTQLADKNDTGKTQKTLSTIGGIGFAAFGAATAAVWFLWPDEKQDSAVTPQLAPTIAKDEIGVTVRGSF